MFHFSQEAPWRRGELIITTTQLYSSKPELRSQAFSNPCESEIHDGEDLWQCSQLVKKPNVSRPSSILQKQFINIIPLLYLALLRTLFHIIFSTAHLAFLCVSSSLLFHLFGKILYFECYQSLNNGGGFIIFELDLSLLVSSKFDNFCCNVA